MFLVLSAGGDCVFVVGIRGLCRRLLRWPLMCPGADCVFVVVIGVELGVFCTCVAGPAICAGWVEDCTAVVEIGVGCSERVVLYRKEREERKLPRRCKNTHRRVVWAVHGSPIYQPSGPEDQLHRMPKPLVKRKRSHPNSTPLIPMSPIQDERR